MDLLGGAARQLLVLEPDVARHLEARQMLADVSPHIGRVEIGAVLGHHDHRQLLAQPVVRNAEGRGLVDGGVQVDDALDFGAVDVLSAAQDHVLLAVADVEEAVLVDLGDVAGSEPAVLDRLRGRLRTVPVAADVHRRLHDQFALFAGRQFVAVVVDDLQFDDRARLAATVRLLDQALVRVAGAAGVRLGHSPAEGPVLVGHQNLQAIHHAAGDRRAAAGHRGQAAQVAILERRRLQHLPGHRRHAVEGRDPLPLDQLQAEFGIPLVHHHDLATGAEGGEQAGVAAADVEERQGHQDRGLELGVLLRFLKQAHGDPLRAVEAPTADAAEHAAMGRDGALGEAGGARREEDRHVVVGAEFDVGHRLAGCLAPHRAEIVNAVGRVAVPANADAHNTEVG